MFRHSIRIILPVLFACLFSAGSLAAELLSVKTKDGSIVYYKAPATQVEAIKLRDYLVQEEFFVDTPREVLLTKDGKTYEFSFVVKKGIETDQEFIATAKQMSKALSHDVFNQTSVDIRLLDENLNLLRVVVAF